MKIKVFVPASHHVSFFFCITDAMEYIKLNQACLLVLNPPETGAGRGILADMRSVEQVRCAEGGCFNQRTILAAGCKKGLMEYYARQATLETPHLRHVHVEKRGCFQTLKHVNYSQKLKHAIHKMLQMEKKEAGHQYICFFSTVLAVNPFNVLFYRRKTSSRLRSRPEKG